MHQRLGSVKKLLKDENIEPVWILFGQGENLSTELIAKQADEPVDILITLGGMRRQKRRWIICRRMPVIRGSL